MAVTASIGASGYTTEIQAGAHGLRADEPAGVGGADRGPTPYDLLLAGLGSCIVMTLRMYADRKGWPLLAATASLRHDRIHARDCAECETEQGMISSIEVGLDLVGPLDDDQRARLTEIAQRCPVHRTLTSEIRIAHV